MKIRRGDLNKLLKKFLFEQDEKKDSNIITVEIKNFYSEDSVFILKDGTGEENFKVHIKTKDGLSIQEGNNINDSKKLAYVGLGLLYAKEESIIKNLLEIGKKYGLETEASDEEIEKLIEQNDNLQELSFYINNKYFSQKNANVIDMSNGIIGMLKNKNNVS